MLFSGAVKVRTFDMFTPLVLKRFVMSVNCELLVTTTHTSVLAVVVMCLAMSAMMFFQLLVPE